MYEVRVREPFSAFCNDFESVGLSLWAAGFAVLPLLCEVRLAFTLAPAAAAAVNVAIAVRDTTRAH
jgi:hypothetical protein